MDGVLEQSPCMSCVFITIPNITICPQQSEKKMSVSLHYLNCQMSENTQIIFPIISFDSYYFRTLYMCYIFGSCTTETEVICTPRLTRRGFQPMTSGSWQYFSCPWDARPDQWAIRDYIILSENLMPHCLKALCHIFWGHNAILT